MAGNLLEVLAAAKFSGMAHPVEVAAWKEWRARRASRAGLPAANMAPSAATPGAANALRAEGDVSPLCQDHARLLAVLAPMHRAQEG